jgi:hypothetical protein
MVITGIVLVALIIFIIVGVTAKKNQEKKNEINRLEHQICQLNKFKCELMSHHTLEDTFKIHKQLGEMHLAWSIAICPDKYGMFRTSNIATMSMDEVFLGDIYGTLTFWLSYQDEDAVSKITNQYYQQVLSGIKAEIEELKKKISSL